METAHKTIFTSKDLETDQEVRWCPGCGDYAILASLKKVLLCLRATEVVRTKGRIQTYHLSSLKIILSKEKILQIL